MNYSSMFSCRLRIYMIYSCIYIYFCTQYYIYRYDLPVEKSPDTSHVFSRNWMRTFWWPLGRAMIFHSTKSFTAPKRNNYTPLKLTWNPNMEVGKMIFLFSWVIFRFHVEFQGCIQNDTVDEVLIQRSTWGSCLLGFNFSLAFPSHEGHSP